MNTLELPFHPAYGAADPPDACLWEPSNNDLDPTGEQPGDFDLRTRAEYDAEWAEMHEALMGGWCFDHPDRPPDGVVVGRYVP